MHTQQLHEQAPALSAAPALEFTQSGVVRHEFMASLLPGLFEQKLLNLVLSSGGSRSLVRCVDGDVAKAAG